jgi:hypothetical protein
MKFKTNKRTMKKGWTIFFTVWCLLFMLFAYWQINDPDPEWWVPAYIGGAMVCGLAAANRFPLQIIAALAVAYLICSFFFWPQEIFGWVSQEMEQKDLTMKTPEMEINREFFGLLLLFSITGLAFWQGRKQVLNNQITDDD